MFEIQNYGSFIAAIFVFQIVPGAGTISILNATARNGAAAGLAAVAGTLCGDFLYMLSAVAGLATIMHGNPLLFQALQWFGACYLGYLGIGLLRKRMDPVNQPDETPTAARVYFRQALAVSLTNPKVILFFVSFFPLFLRQSTPGSTLLIMMLHVTIISFLYQAGLVLVGNMVASHLKAIPGARRLATRLAGVALIGFGMKLAAGNR